MSWLTTETLEDKIRKFASKETKKAYIGIFPIDQLPKRIDHYPVLMIINTDTKNLPGEHWKAVYISPQRHGEVFDSFALPISTYLLKWMNTFTHGHWKQNAKSIQHPLSAICGVYTLYFVLNRLKKDNLRSIMRIFDSSPSANDKLMLDFFSTLKNK